jgi:hypothetical protein
VRDLYAIKYMDLFLEDSAQVSQYHRLLRTLETFRDIGRMMITVESDYPDDYDRGLKVLFAAVRAGKPYGDIRQLRQMFRNDRSRFDRLANGISQAEAQIQPETKPTLTSPAETSPDESDDEEDEDSEGAGPPSVTNYPPEIGRMIDVAIDGYQASQQDDILKTLREVVNRLEALAEDDRLDTAVAYPTEGADIRAALKEIVQWVDEHRGLLDNDG